jgi:erythromycin esterase
MPAQPTHPAQLSAWIREHAATLTTLDPDAPLDDLGPLRHIVGDARVVAIGENAHFIREYWHVRQRLLRFLAERCGFTVFALEFGFAEGFALDSWLHGAGRDEDLAKVSPAADAWGARDAMHWLRRYNKASSTPVRFVGIDIPEAGGSLLPALNPVAEYLREVDPQVVPSIEAAISIANDFAGLSAARAAPAWARLDVARQDALTAHLARLQLRFRAVEPLYVSRSSQQRFDTALRQLEAAAHADHMLRAMSALFAGKGLPADSSVRELYMAESVRWHLDHAEAGTRIVLAAHNNHIQKTSVAYGGQLFALPMGQLLQRRLGDAYLSLAVTSTADHTAEMHLDDKAPVGFTVARASLHPPEPGSIEAAITGAGLSRRPTLIDLRRAPRPGSHGGETIDRIRSQSTYMHTSVLDAFDAVLAIPTATLDENLGL